LPHADDPAPPTRGPHSARQGLLRHGVAEVLLPSHAHALGAKLIIAANDINLLIDGGLATVARLSATGA